MSRFVFVGIIGIGLGWLIGLSQSPVIAGVVTALLALAAALVGALGNPEEAAAGGDSRLHKVARLISPAPLAALMLGIAVGAPAGLYARNIGLFSAPRADHMQELETAVARWEALGIKREVIVARLFEREFPEQKDAPGEPTSDPGAIPSGLVASGSADECASFRRVGKDQLLLELRSSRRTSVRSLANALADTPDSARMGELILEAVCPPKS